MTAEPKKEKPEFSKENTQTALVAGGAGFIGSHLCEALLNQNWRVFCADNLSTGSKETIKDLLVNPNFHFIEADITHPLDFLEGVEGLDVIFHLASLEAQSQNQKFSLETLLVNSSGTRNLLETAKKYKAKFILVSSADIYQGSFSSSSLKIYFGEGKQEAIMSQHEAKRFAEALTVEFYKNYSLEASIARVLDVYGPRMNLEGEGELTSLIASAKEGEKLLIVGDGLTTLNPTFVSDVVFGLIKIATGDFKGEIFNLIDPEKTTALGLAETLRLVAGDLEIEHSKASSSVELPPAPIDLEGSKEKLKWHPRVNLAEGLSSTFQAFRGVPAKMVDLALAPTSPAEKIYKKEEKGKNRSHLRLLIFSSSLALVLLTTAVPFISFVWNSREASKNLLKASENLDQDKTTTTIDLIKTVQEKTRAADQNLTNIRWLFQISGQATTYRANEQYLLATENSATAVELTAQAVKNIIDADELTKSGEVEKGREKLSETSQVLVEVQQNLDLSEANLDQVKTSKLAPSLGVEAVKLKSLNQKIAALASSVSEALKTSLESIEASASTAP
ncbi:MAG: NAD-dependent epimerase/dehydratase family protein [bacterium]|nr:NAD-dependent epimerase/dehydratase family protein [bacterium]